MRNKALSVNIDNSDLVNYPNGRIKNNSGAGDGTPVNEFLYGDLHEFKDKLMRLAGIEHNGLPDDENNGFQSIEALRDFGSKHDVIQTLTSASGVATVSAKLNTIIQNNESLICKAGFNYTTETSIKGSDGTVYSLTVIGNFKSNEYVRLIKNGSGVILVRLIDVNNIDIVVSELLYLKKANQLQEDEGLLDTVATTPLINKTTFTKRINGIDSSGYLATPSRNGLLSKEDKDKIDNLESIIIGTGSVSSSGLKLSQKGINFTSSRITGGVYLIVHNFGFSNYGVAGAGFALGTFKVAMESRNTNSCVLVVSDDSSPNDGDFSFMFYKL